MSVIRWSIQQPLLILALIHGQILNVCGGKTTLSGYRANTYCHLSADLAFTGLIFCVQQRPFFCTIQEILTVIPVVVGQQT